MSGALNPRTKSLAAVILGSILILGALVAVIVYAATRPNTSDFRTARYNLIEKASDTQTKLAPAFDAYTISFKQVQNQTSSIKKATDGSVKERREYHKAEAAARQAIQNLKNSRVANDSAGGIAVRQYVEASEEYVDYFASLLDFYDEFNVLFSKQEKVCIDVLVGKTSSLDERKNKLKSAAKDCYPALERLKESGNTSYVEYAATVKSRIKSLEEYSVAIAKGEQDYKRFESEQKALQKRLADTPEDAPASQYSELLKDVKELDGKIKRSQSAFETAGSRYKSTVEQLPDLYGDVFADAVPKRIKILNSLTDVRKNTLIAVLDGKLLDE